MLVSSEFITQDKLIIGICNGCQIVSNLGLIPGFENHYGERDVALLHNQSARLVTRWLDMRLLRKLHGLWVSKHYLCQSPMVKGNSMHQMRISKTA